MLKKFLIGTFALALVVSVGAMTADAFSGVTLKVGSRGADVMELQTIVGATPIDGVFGFGTKAKVMAWQASHGLVADGVVGPATQAAMTAGGNTGTFPAGCTSAVGFSSTTGLSCAGTVGTYPAGCTSTVGYSSTTGAKCDGTTGGTTPEVLTGEGSVKSFDLGSPEESSLAEGQENAELVSFDVELENDGSLKMDRFDLYMAETGTADVSEKPWDYFSNAYLMSDGVKIATMDVSSSSDWAEDEAGLSASQEYRLRFSGLNAVLKSDETTTISVAFDAVSNLDSVDEVATWDFGILNDSFRFVDGTGYMFTDGDDSLSDSFDIDTADTADLSISAGSNDPDALTIEVSDSSDTNGVTIGQFEVEESNDVDVNITEMEVTIATDDTITDVASRLYLYNGSSLVGEERVNAGLVTFDNIDLNINGDETVTLTVKVDLNDTNDQVRYQNGDTLGVTDVEITALTDANENDEGDVSGLSTETYASETHHLYATGIAVSDFSSVKTTTTFEGNNTKISYAITYKISAFGDDFYVPKTIVQGTSSVTAGLTYTVYDETAGAVTTSGTESASAISSSANTVSDYFKVAKGDTETFTATISVTKGTITAGDYIHVQLDQVGYDDNQAGNVTEFNLTPAQDYDTQSDTLDA